MKNLIRCPECKKLYRIFGRSDLLHGCPYCAERLEEEYRKQQQAEGNDPIFRHPLPGPLDPRCLDPLPYKEGPGYISPRVTILPPYESTCGDINPKSVAASAIDFQHTDRL